MWGIAVINDKFSEFSFRVKGDKLVFACLLRFGCIIILLDLFFEVIAARWLGFHSYIFAKFIINFMFLLINMEYCIEIRLKNL